MMSKSFLLLVSVSLNIAQTLVTFVERSYYLHTLTGSPLLRSANDASSIPTVTSTAASTQSVEESSEKTIQIYPLLKELGCGWGNHETMPIISKRNATNLRLLVVDVGLHDGQEFFQAVQNGYEVVGFEPNPYSFQLLEQKCADYAASKTTTKCKSIPNIHEVSLPLTREEGVSYIVQAAAGNLTGFQIMNIPKRGITRAVGTFADNNRIKRDSNAVNVTVVRLDEVLDEDVFFFKSDAQGFDYHVLQGAKGLFQQNTVRQLTFELDPSLCSLAGVKFEDLMSLVHVDYGMQCFSAFSGDPANSKWIRSHSDTAEALYKEYFEPNWLHPEQNRWHSQFHEELLCVNWQKAYDGALPQLIEQP